MKKWQSVLFTSALQLIQVLAKARAAKPKEPKMIASPTVVARRFDYVRETEGQNRGTWVSLFQRFTGNRPGDSWCASFVSLVLDIVFRGQSPLRRSASCDVLLQQCMGAHYIVDTPQVDDLFFYVREWPVIQSQVDAYHVGIVTALSPDVIGIAGNTSPDGQDTNGSGVFEHALPKNKIIVFARLPR